MPPLRVGFLIDRWEPSRGGAERACAQLAQHLLERGHEVHAFAESAGEHAPGSFHPVRSGVAPKGLLRARHERALARGLVGAAERAGCAVTIGVRHLPRVDLYWPHGGDHALSVAARRRSHGELVERALGGRHRAFLDLERQLLDQGGARRIVAVSRMVHAELALHHPACLDRLVTVENGVDLARFRPENRALSSSRLREALALSVDGPLIAFLAREPRLKGLPALYAALARLGGQRFSLVVAGSPDVERWRRAARRAGLAEGRVRVLAEAEPAALLAAADLLVLPTWRDTSSLVVLEALASGTPVVTTLLAGAAARVTSESGTVVAGPADVAGLAGAIAAWLGRIEAHAIDRAAVRAAVADLSLDTWLARMEQEVLGVAELAERSQRAP